jgi:predicted Na+-dependent transporter
MTPIAVTIKHSTVHLLLGHFLVPFLGRLNLLDTDCFCFALAELVAVVHLFVLLPRLLGLQGSSVVTGVTVDVSEMSRCSGWRFLFD